MCPVTEAVERSTNATYSSKHGADGELALYGNSISTYFTFPCPRPMPLTAYEADESPDIISHAKKKRERERESLLVNISSRSTTFMMPQFSQGNPHRECCFSWGLLELIDGSQSMRGKSLSLLSASTFFAPSTTDNKMVFRHVRTVRVSC